MKDRIRKVQIKEKIDSDFMLKLFDELQNLKGEERRKMINKINFFKKHIGEYLVK